MHIRPATPKDTRFIHETTQAYNRTRNDPHETGFFEFPTPHKETYERILTEHPCFIAEDDTPIGFLTAFNTEAMPCNDPIRTALAYEMRRNLYIEQVAVLEPHRNRGIATALFLHALTHAQLAGRERAYAASISYPTTNTAAQKLLATTGFSNIETLHFHLNGSGPLSFDIYGQPLQTPQGFY